MYRAGQARDTVMAGFTCRRRGLQYRQRAGESCHATQNLYECSRKRVQHSCTTMASGWFLFRACSTTLCGRIYPRDARIVLAGRSSRVTYTIPAVRVETSSTLRSLCHTRPAFRTQDQSARKAERKGCGRIRIGGIASGFAESILQEAVPLEIVVGQRECAEVGVGNVWRVRNVHNERSRDAVVAPEECSASGEIQGT